MLHTIGTVIDYDAQAFKRFYVYAEMNCWVKYVTMWSFLGGSFTMATFIRIYKTIMLVVVC